MKSTQKFYNFESFPKKFRSWSFYTHKVQPQIKSSGKIVQEKNSKLTIDFFNEVKVDMLKLKPNHPA